MLDLEKFDTEAAPQVGKSDLKRLKDGEYDFEIRGGRLKPTKANEMIFVMDLTVMSEGPFVGAELERPSFLKSQESFNIFLSDLAKLGFDTENWTVANGRPASKQVEKASWLLKGIRFKGKKVTNGNFANLYITDRSKEDGKPEKFGAEELANAKNPDPF